MANDLKNQAHKLDTTWTMLKLTYGIVPIVAGADKFFNMLTNWEMYLNPMFAKMVPLSTMHLMYAVGVVEMLAGLTVLFFCTRVGGYVVALWLTVIAISLIAMGRFYDVAVRDIVMAVGAIALAQLTEIREDLKNK
ncbi:MAG: hypothetical protein P4L31_05170 [Candidatus Babeliales bacterium]|nr:hypothetical protein [Candidatus Babeliales bacterium]